LFTTLQTATYFSLVLTFELGKGKALFRQTSNLAIRISIAPRTRGY
jgi:hypothetical protein